MQLALRVFIIMLIAISLVFGVDKNDSGIIGIKSGDTVRHHNSLIITGISAVVPGAGQIVTGHYVKAGMFLALEGIFLGSTDFWKKRADYYDDISSQALISSESKSGIDKALLRESAFLDQHSAAQARRDMTSFATWAAGVYVYNLFDAYQSSLRGIDTRERSASKAFLLSIVPGCGIGQLYNGRFSKAGMVIMAQWSLGMMAYNNQKLMTRATDNYERLSGVMAADSLMKSSGNAQGMLSRWSGERGSAFTNRNMYLWYSIFFYFYSVFDAVVDAYLHDYPDRMKIEPDLTVGKNNFHFSVTAPF